MATRSSASSSRRVEGSEDVLEIEELLAGRFRRGQQVVGLLEQQGEEGIVHATARRPPPAVVEALRAPGVQVTTASMRAFDGPMSKATGSRPDASTVTFEMPPRFSAPRTTPGGGARRRTSSTLASGAPWPPAAMSRLRTSLTTLAPVRSAIQAGCPS